MSEAVKLPPEALEIIARKFEALSDHVRLGILQELKEGEKSGKELIDILGVSQSTVSKHLKKLFEVKIVGKRQEGNLVYYYVSDESIEEICELVCSNIKNDLLKLTQSFD
jgi:DNA-binding transcriptional ArsR family regulator